MDPREQFPDLFQAWQDEGGDEKAVLSAFGDHLRGLGVLPPDVEAARDLTDKLSATVAQLRKVVENLPFP